ncbi:MAG: hypothetical protein ACOYJD_05360 [Christensenellales bacterium]|jgi:hypothetical protein
MFTPFYRLPMRNDMKPGFSSCHRPKPRSHKPQYSSALPIVMQLSESRDYDRLICIIRDLYPYMSENERRTLSSLIDLDSATKNARVYVKHDYTIDRGRPLSAIDRQKGLMKVLDKYSRGKLHDSRRMLDLIEQIRKAGSGGTGAALAALAPMMGGSGPELTNILTMLNAMK